MNAKSGKKHCLVVTYFDGRADPPTRMCAESLAAAGFVVHLIQGPRALAIESAPLNQVKVVEAARNFFGIKPKPLRNIFRWALFKFNLFRLIRVRNPEIVVTVMLHGLAALPRGFKEYTLISCVYDIPSAQDVGRLDRVINDKGWQRLHEADVVWCSDPYKAELAQDLGELNEKPLVVYNCAKSNYIETFDEQRDPWLRSELRKGGAVVDGDTCIIIRAGAIGPSGGIEETIEALERLPPKFLFLMIGRPNADYSRRLLALVESKNLQRRAILWETPSDTIWKLAIQGADIGHLIHGPFPPGPLKRNFELNSSLSNNRLFQYMAAGLPILSYDDPRLEQIHREVGCFEVIRIEHLVDDIEAACAKLSASPSRRQELGMNGRRAHLAKYNWEHQFSTVLSEIVQYQNDRSQ
jgi:glycosyltransferase involved in cell wall biosynthesis